jgi:hypothetical protein
MLLVYYKIHRTCVMWWLFLTCHLCTSLHLCNCHWYPWENMFCTSGWHLIQCVISNASDRLFCWSFLCDMISSWWDSLFVIIWTYDNHTVKACAMPSCRALLTSQCSLRLLHVAVDCRNCLLSFSWGHVVTRLRQCATSWKFVCSFSDGVTGIFHWLNPSGCPMDLGWTQPLREINTRGISCG